MLTRDFLYCDSPKYAASAPVRLIVVGRFECGRITAENGVQETTGFPGLSNGLTGRKSLSMFLQECRLSNIK